MMKAREIAKETKPRTTNSGAENTTAFDFEGKDMSVENATDQGLRILIDWFEGTFRAISDVREIIDLLGLKADDFTEMPYGAFGWTSCLANQQIKIFYGGEKKEGVRLQVTGQGCRLLETSTSRDWNAIIRDSLQRGMSPSRVDLAIDDFGKVPKRKRGGAPLRPHFTIGTLIRKVMDGLCRSKFEKVHYMGSVRLANGESLGKTIYFGSDASRVQIYAYEKHHERMAKGFELEEGVQVWNRMEVRARKERAKVMLEKIASGMPVGEVALGIIRHYLAFVDRTDDENKARWPISRFWETFLGNVQRLALTLEAPDRTLTKIEKWIQTQVEKSLGLLFLAVGGDWEYFQERIESGIEKIADRDWQMFARTLSEFTGQRKLRKIEDDPYVRKLAARPYLTDEEIIERDNLFTRKREEAEAKGIKLPPLSRLSFSF